MTKRDYYDILSISRNATTEEIKRSYRQLALKYHPDRNPGNKEAEEKFKEGAEAYSVLCDPEKRRTYDMFGHEGLRGVGYTGFAGFDSSIFEGFEDILGSFFGFGDLFGTRRSSKRYGPQRGRDLALELEITLEEAGNGVEREIKLNRAELCPACRGARLQPGTSKSLCPSCQGRGQVRYQQGFFTISRTCSHCQGAGEVITVPCDECRGTGRTKKKRAIKVRIPAGIDDGNRLRIEGEGEAGEAEGLEGDLYVDVRVAKHPFFEREENNLSCQIQISFAQAALGATLEIPTLEGESELLKIPAGTQSGEVFRLKGKGIRDIHHSRKGDFFIRVQVKTPDSLSREQKELLRQFAQLRGEDLDRIDRSLLERIRDIFH